MRMLIGWLAPVLSVLASSISASADEYRVTEAFVVAAEPACMPAMTRARNGDLLVAYSTEWEPFPPGGTLKLVRSTDGGRTWSEPIIIATPKHDNGTYHLGSGMTTLSDGRILLPTTYGLVHQRRSVEPGTTSPYRIWNIWDHRNTRQIELLESDNNGQTWNARVIYTAEHQQWITSFGRIIELPNGDLLLWAYWGKYNDEQDGNDWRAHGFLRSRDGGKSWIIQEMPRPWESEISPALLADGTLLAVMRHNGDGDWPRRVFGVSRSTDGGRNWSEPAPSDGVRGKMPDLLVLPSGRVLMGVGAEGLSDGSEILTTKSRRSFATIFVSDDGGRTWRKDAPLVPADQTGTIVPADSPQLISLDDDRVLVIAQAIDRSKDGDELLGYSVGMSLIGNILEPAAKRETD